MHSILQSAIKATTTLAEKQRILGLWLLYYPEMLTRLKQDARAHAILIEKTPENFFLGPMLRQLTGGCCAALFVAVRHPLVWAIVIGKWVGNHITSNLGSDSLVYRLQDRGIVQQFFSITLILGI